MVRAAGRECGWNLERCNEGREQSEGEECLEGKFMHSRLLIKITNWFNSIGGKLRYKFILEKSHKYDKIC